MSKIKLVMTAILIVKHLIPKTITTVWFDEKEQAMKYAIDGKLRKSLSREYLIKLSTAGFEWLSVLPGV